MKRKIKLSKSTIMFALAISVLGSTIIMSIAQLTIQSQATELNDQKNWMYMRVEGITSGLIEGDLAEAGHEGWIEVIGYHHQVYRPVGGRTVHCPFRIVKPIDKASPKLMTVLINNEVLVEVKLEFWRMSVSSGILEHWYTITLTNALISSIESYGTLEEHPTETISFSYGIIEWIDEINGVSAIEDLQEAAV